LLCLHRRGKILGNHQGFPKLYVFSRDSISERASCFIQFFQAVVGCLTIVHCAFDHSVGVDRCWLRTGELGVGDTSGRNVPTQVTLPDSATQISVGAGFACAILANTQLWCWGASYGGVFLSQGDSTVPQQITGIPGTISDLSAGCDMMSVIIAGTTYYWGGNQWWGNYVQDLGMTGTYTQIVSVGIVGGAFAIRNDGSVWCDSFGVYCGDGSTNQGVIESNITSGATFVMSANGGACAIVTLGGQPTLECWGSGLDGSLGTSPQLDGSVDPVVTPFDTFSWN